MAMTTDEVREAVRRMCGAYPQMTPEQVAYWTDELLRREKWTSPVFHAAFDDYCERHMSYVDTGLLHALIHRRCMQAAGVDPVQIQRERRAEERRAWEAGVAEIEQTIAAMTDQELARHKFAIVEQQTVLNPIVGKRLAQADPRKSAWLKGLIVERVRSGADQEEAAGA